MYLLLNFSVQAKYNETTATTSNFFSNVSITGKYFKKIKVCWGVINSPISTRALNKYKVEIKFL